MCTNMQCVVGLSVLLFSVACADNCSTWLHPSGDGQCSCGPSLGTVVVCNNETQEVGVLSSFCLTSSGDGSNTSVVGRCPMVLHNGERLLSPVGIYDKVLPNISEQDQQTCGYFNRQGQLCGKCIHNHFVSAYSYDIKCHNCTSTLWSGVVKCLSSSHCLPLCCDSISYQCHFSCFKCSSASLSIFLPTICSTILVTIYS